MRARLLLPVVLLGSAAPSVGWRDPVVGDVVRLSHDTVLDLPLVATLPGGRTREAGLRRRHRQDVRYEVLAVGKTGPERLALTWGEDLVETSGPDGARIDRLPVAGRTYRVDLPTAQVPGVEGPEADIAVSASDLFALLRAFRDMVGPDPREGQVLPAPQILAGLIREAPGDPVVTGTLTVGPEDVLGGVPCRTVDLEVGLTSTGALEDGVVVEAKASLSGRFWLDARTGWTRRLEVWGPITLEGSGMRGGTAFTLRGEGGYRAVTTVDPG